jgi:hypothetical protein
MDARIIPDQVGDRRPGMTKIFPRRDCVRVVQESFASKTRAQGMPGARRTRSLAWGKNKNHTSIVTTGPPESPGIPCAMVLTVSFALSSVTGLVCHRRPQEAWLLENLTPASGRQDHTTSPSARQRVRPSRALRPSHPVPNVRDDRETPLLMRTGRGRYSGDLRFGKTEIFLLRGLDKGKTVEQACGDLPVGQTSLSLFQWRKS